MCGARYLQHHEQPGQPHVGGSGPWYCSSFCQNTKEDLSVDTHCWCTGMFEVEAYMHIIAPQPPHTHTYCDRWCLQAGACMHISLPGLCHKHIMVLMCSQVHILTWLPKLINSSKDRVDSILPSSKYTAGVVDFEANNRCTFWYNLVTLVVELCLNSTSEKVL